MSQCGASKPPPASGRAEAAWPEGDQRPGRRSAVRKGAPENRFDTQGQGRWSSIHADANGAYNIQRKACPGFRRHAGLSSAFEIMSPGPNGLRRIHQSTLKGQRASAKKEAAQPPCGGALASLPAGNVVSLSKKHSEHALQVGA